MKERKKQLLKLIVENYIRTAQPVSSEVLVSKLKVSSATIRNEMAELVEEGYLDQPHVSAGRIPATLGYQFYVDHYLQKDRALSQQKKYALKKIGAMYRHDLRKMIKGLAKKMVEVADNAVVVGFSPHDVYYTGLTNIFSQPEFSHIPMIINISQVIDHMDEVMGKLFSRIEGVRIEIGESNLFSPQCSLVVSDFLFDDDKGVLGILGPLRMDYHTNYALVNYSVDMINRMNV